MENTTTKAWDPLGDAIHTKKYQHDLLQTLARYQKMPYLPLLNLFLCCLLTIFFLFLCVYFSADGDFYLMSFAPPILYLWHVLLIQRKLILLMLSQKNNWQYDPEDDTNRPEMFKTIFPQIFDKGRDQTFSQQIWGSVLHQNVMTSFWTTKFSYIVGSGRSRRTYNEYVFAFPLPKVLPASFILQKASRFALGKNELETESHEFNKTLSILLPDNSPEVKQKILQVLSPSIQTRITDFAKTYQPYMIIFHHNLLVINIGKSIWKTRHTNLFFSPHISPKDIEQFTTDIITMAQLPSEMLAIMD